MMSCERELAATVALLRLEHRSDAHCLRLIERSGSAERALDEELGIGGAQPRLFTNDAAQLIDQASADLRVWLDEGIRVCRPLDDCYPANLRHVADRPALVFLAGRLTAADDRAVAVIGARRATRRGTDTARSFAAGFVDAGYTVVSGLAAGIDAAAHEGALRRGGRTIAVVGTGLRQCYPRENADLQRRIAEECAVVSQFWPDTPPRSENFPLRNGTMSGVSRGSVIIEASERSGARVQARLALAHGRPVFVLDRLLDAPWARGLAARAGVHVVGGPEEVMARLAADVIDARARE